VWEVCNRRAYQRLTIKEEDVAANLDKTSKDSDVVIIEAGKGENAIRDLPRMVSRRRQARRGVFILVLGLSLLELHKFRKRQRSRLFRAHEKGLDELGPDELDAMLPQH
jgi:hypothetical protein